MAATRDISDALVARPILIARLGAAIDRGGALLVAGAGYGKTCALQQTLANRSEPTIWLSCAAAGGDAGVLLLTLVKRLRQVVPGSADVLAERLDATRQRVDVAALARTLRSELEQLVVDPVILVLDDAEELEGSSDAIEFVDVLLHADPRVVRIAVASRHPLALRTAKLRAAGRVTEFGAGDLAFSIDECTAVLARRYDRDPSGDELETLMAGTEGWPLGVALSAATPVRSAQAGPGAVFAFLDEEVMAGIDDDLRRGVLDCAAAPDLTPALLERLGLPADFPDRAQRAGLVLQYADDGAPRWSFHPLLREFLRARLVAERAPAELRELHARVASALVAAGRAREAVDHWLEAGEWRTALEVMVRLGQKLQRISPETIRAWLAHLPTAAWEEPSAHLVLGQLEWGAGRHELAIAPLRAAVIGYDALADPASAWLARSLLCDALFSTGGFDEILELTAGWDAPALARLGRLPVGVAWFAVFVLLSRGRFERADALLQRLRADLPLTPLMGHFSCIFEAYREITRGCVDTGLALVAGTVEEIEEQEAGNHAWPSFAGLALIQMDIGQRAEALETWERLAAYAEAGGLAFAVNSARRARAFLYADAGDLPRAEAELAGAGLPAGGGWHDASYHTAQAAIALLRHEPANAVAAAERALALVRPTATNFRVWTACATAPILVAAGATQLAQAAIDETLAAVDEAFPGDHGRGSRARLLAVRAWIRGLGGDVDGADADLERAWAQARGCEHYILRGEWPRLEPLFARALERGRLDPTSVVGAVQRALPGGAALVRFIDHPVPEVRRVALAAAIASGHPGALERLDGLAQDPDAGVAAAAVAAGHALSHTGLPLRFQTLGGFRVRRANWELDGASWGRPQAARLVRYLLVHRGTPVPEDDLFAAFWPDKEPAGARHNLAVTLSLARKALDLSADVASIIQTGGRSHQLVLRPSDRVDSEEFEAAAAAALQGCGPEAIALLERADALWSGDPLPDERYCDWTFEWRERLTDRYGHVLAALAREYTQAGRVEDATRLARKCVELDPLNEGAQRYLMISYARGGRRNHALRQFLACRRVLVEELGIEPSEATVRLQDRILAGTPV